MNYTHAEAKDARRKLISMLPETVTVHTGVLNFGRTLSVLISNSMAEMKTYEFGWVGRTPTCDGRQGEDFSNKAIMAIADEWSTGSVFIKAYVPTVKAAPATPYIITKDALVDWVAKARKGDMVVYFRGSIAQFRDDAPRRIVELQRRADQAPQKKPQPAKERAELFKLQRERELLAQIDLFMRKDLITVSQRPDIEGNGTAYLAIRKGKNMAVSHPYVEAKLKNEIKNAITIAWAKFSKEFQIQAIDWEGGTDDTHMTTAKVLIYRGNPQDPTTIMIPAIDLGENRKKWPHILHAKGKKAANMVNAREGRVKRKITSLEDDRI